MFSEQNYGSKIETTLAFVSACHSEEIGQIFKKVVPVVIAVNSDNAILDDACKLFSQEFYAYLLMGQTIENAFENSKLSLKFDVTDLTTCCCSHKHSDDCAWYKFYQEKPDEAHAMHSKKCTCASHF